MKDPRTPVHKEGRKFMGVERLSASCNRDSPLQKRYKDTVLSVDIAALLGVVRGSTGAKIAAVWMAEQGHCAEPCNSRVPFWALRWDRGSSTNKEGFLSPF